MTRRRRWALPVAFALAAAAFVPRGAAADPSWIGAGACGGIAPGTTDCSTGMHTYYGIQTVTHGILVGDDYTGTVESRISSLDHTTSFRCHFERGRAIGYCQESGEWPWWLVPVTHSCVSYDRMTTTRGGYGTWACYFVHA